MEFSTQSDLAAVVEGDRTARSAFVHRFDRMVWKAARAVGLKGRDRTPEDVYQELWAHVFAGNCRVLRAYTGRFGASFPTYLCRCMALAAVSIGRDVSRREAMRRRLAAADPEAMRVLGPYRPSLPDAVCERHERQQQFALVYRGLPSRTREFFDSSVLEERPAAELRRAFCLPSENAVYQHRCRVLALVRGKLSRAARG